MTEKTWTKRVKLKVSKTVHVNLTSNQQHE